MKRFMACMLALLVALPSLALAALEDPGSEAVAIIEQALAGDVDAYYDRLSPELQGQIPKEALATLGTDLEASFGPFVGLGPAQVIGSVVSIQVQMEAMNLLGQVVFDGDDMIIGLGFVPDMSAAEKEEITRQANEEDVSVGPKGLPGFLTLPEGVEKAPAVVLVHGSGPNDRNEALGNLAIFRDLAKGLSEQGIAVLRYDKRTYAMNQGTIDYTMEEIENLTVYDETIEDAVAAVALLREDARIDPERVFVLGHSQGGMLAARIQQAGADADGLIILAGTLRHLSELIVDQLSVQDAGTGILASEIELARDLPGMTEAEARERMLLGASAYPMWEEAQHDLVQAAEENEAPMLILQGTEDANVYADVDYVLWQEFAAEHPQKDIEFRLYEGLAHNFADENGMAQAVIDDISAWVLAR